MKNIALILAGGRGKRFWPHSRFNKPKQFLATPGGNIMLRDTFERLLPYFNPEDIYIATIEDLFQPIREIIPEIDILNYIIEPVGKDTAASMALAALLITHYRGKDINIAIFPIDHYIPEKEKFYQLLDSSFQAVLRYNKPVIVGIEPKRKEPRYGYICAATQPDHFRQMNLYPINLFKEKPDFHWIEQYSKKNQLFWNSAIYIFPASMILTFIEKYMPALDKAIKEIALSIGTLSKSEVIKTQFRKIDSISFEYGILEKVNDLLVIKGDLIWEDIGSWQAMERFIPHDAQGNIVQGEYIGLDTRNCIIINDKGLTVTIGLSNLVIINDGPIQLIFPKNREGDIKKIINQMARNERFKKYI